MQLFHEFKPVEFSTLPYDSVSQSFRWREPNPDLHFFPKAAPKDVDRSQWTRFNLLQNDVCYTKY